RSHVDSRPARTTNSRPTATLGRVSAESREVRFPNLSGVELAGRLELPDGEPVGHALFAHCFTCSSGGAAASRVSRGLAAAGWAVLRFDFTGLGNSAGDFGNTGFSSNLDDLVAAADHLRRTVEAPTLLIGHSLGGAAVLAAAERIPEVRAIATLAAPHDPAHVTRLFRGRAAEIDRDGRATVSIAGREFTVTREFLADLAEQPFAATLARLERQGVLLLHAPEDEVVDVGHAGRIYAALPH